MSQLNWYYDEDGEAVGPCSPDELRDLASSGSISPETRIRPGTEGDWILAGTLKTLFKNRPDPKNSMSSTEYKRIPVFGTESLEMRGSRIAQTLPVVRARRVYGINVLKDLFVTVRDVFGGRSKTLENSFETMEVEVIDELKMKAAAINANAIVKFHLQHGVVESGSGGSVMVYVMGQGTPVIVEPTAATTGA